MRTDLLTRIKNLNKRKEEIQAKIDKCAKELAERIASRKIDINNIVIKLPEKPKKRERPTKQTRTRKSKTPSTIPIPEPMEPAGGQEQAGPTNKAQPLYRCENCGNEFEIPATDINGTKCPKCWNHNINAID